MEYRFLGKSGIKISALSFGTWITFGQQISEGLNASLKRLQMEYVDLIFCHRPDKHTPIEETVWAMNQIIQQGKALYWGTSEWNAYQILDAYRIARREHLIPPL